MAILKLNPLRLAVGHSRNRRSWFQGTKTLRGIGPYLTPDLAHDPSWPSLEVRRQAYQAGDAQQVHIWLDAARAELTRKQPGFALLLGNDLHYLDIDEYRAVALELLVAGYRMLGREALADIVIVHERLRDLESVNVYD